MITMTTTAYSEAREQVTPRSRSRSRSKSKSKLVLSQATTSDLPAMVELQFKTFATLPIEVLIFGTGTPAEKEVVLQRHLAHVQQNSGLYLVKVEDVEEESNQTHPKTTLVGSCMFYLPNEDAASAEERKPPSLRRSPARRTIDHLADESKRVLVEDFINLTHDRLLECVADRPCGYIRYMAVHPAYRRQGIGSMLMNWGCQLFDNAGVDVALQATFEGESLYRNYGFRTIGTVEAQDGSVQGAQFAIMWRDAVTAGAGAIIISKNK